MLRCAVPWQEAEAFQGMYENGGLLATEDGSMAVLAGATLGGGTRINWCARRPLLPWRYLCSSAWS